MTRIKIVLFVFVLSVAHAAQAESLLIHTKTSACLDALMLASMLNAPELPANDLNLVQSWKDKIQQDDNDALKVSIEILGNTQVPIKSLIPECENGFLFLADKLKKKDPAWLKKITKSHLKISPFRRPKNSNASDEDLKRQENESFIRKLSLTSVFFEYLKNNGYEKDWNITLAPKAKKMAALLEAWQSSAAAERLVNSIAPWVCGKASRCLNGYEFWVSGFESKILTNLRPKSWIVSARFDDDLPDAMAELIANAYESDVAMKPTPQFGYADSEKPLFNFRAWYAQMDSYNPIVAKALSRLAEYRLKKYDYLAALRGFVRYDETFNYMLDPVGMSLFLKLNQKLEKNQPVSRKDVEEYLKDFEKSGYEMHLEGLKKELAPANGFLGIGRESHPDGFKVKMIILNEKQVLRKGDVVVGVNGQLLRGLSKDQVDHLIRGVAGEVKKISLRRNERPLELNATLQSYNHSDRIMDQVVEAPKQKK